VKCGVIPQNSGLVHLGARNELSIFCMVKFTGWTFFWNGQKPALLHTASPFIKKVLLLHTFSHIIRII